MRILPAGTAHDSALPANLCGWDALLADVACRRSYVHSEANAHVPPGGARIEPPRCEACGARIRPGVVWFGESLPAREWQSACDAAKRCDLFLCCGTASVVQPAASLIDMAIGAGATTVQINPNATDYDDSVTISIRGPAGMVLPRMVAETWPGIQTQTAQV